MRNNLLENLELKLINTRLENSEKLDLIEAEYKKEYSDFFDEIFKNDNLAFKRFISVSFQLDKLDNPDKSNNEIFKNSLKKSLSVLLVSDDKKVVLESKLLSLLGKKDRVNEIYIKNTDLRKDYNFPIIESLEVMGALNKDDLLKIVLKYKEKNNFLDSIDILDDSKKDLVKKHYYDLNNSKSSERENNFENDFNDEIKESKSIQSFPKVIKFLGKNYFRLRIKQKVESKKDRLKRVFKIAFLKLYRLKYSGIDINGILKKIDNLDDIDSIVNLLLKYFDELRENPTLTSDYVVSDEVDDISEIFVQAEENKEKVLFLEKNTVKAANILESGDKHITLKNLDSILGKDVDLVGNNFINRNESLSDGIKAESEKQLIDVNEDNDDDDDDDDDDDELGDIDLYEYYDNLKYKFLELEKKKSILFLNGNYDDLDIINEDILNLTVKLEKVSKLIGIED